MHQTIFPVIVKREKKKKSSECEVKSRKECPFQKTEGVERANIWKANDAGKRRLCDTGFQGSHLPILLESAKVTLTFKNVG